MVKYLPLPSRTHRLGGWGRWKDERIQRNEKLRVVKLHTRTSHSIVPRAVRPSRDWRGGRWEVPGDQVVDRGRSTGPVLPCMPDSRVACTLGPRKEVSKQGVGILKIAAPGETVPRSHLLHVADGGEEMVAHLNVTLMWRRGVGNRTNVPKP
jgi:hypothetical protein